MRAVAIAAAMVVTLAGAGVALEAQERGKERVPSRTKAKPAAAKKAQAKPTDGQERPAVVDGDSIVVGGVEWRLAGFDTPEIDHGARCEGERRAGLFAKRRLEELISAARKVETIHSGEADRYQRPLGRLLLDGRDAKDIMIEEGYARPYNGGLRKGWCSRDSLDTLVPGLPPKKRGGKP